MKSHIVGITKRQDFEAFEKNALVTLPNSISVARGVGGLALGYLMLRGVVSPGTAAVGALGLAVSDAEGSLINMAKKWLQKIRDGLRIWPSKQGVYADVANDKLFTGGVLVGGISGGYISGIAGLIAIPELATVAATAYATKRLDNPPIVGRFGKQGMIARFSTVSAYLMASAVENPTTSGILEKTGHVSTALALSLGALSCFDIYRQGKDAEAINP